jgi:hypothetical protein
MNLRHLSSLALVATLGLGLTACSGGEESASTAGGGGAGDSSAMATADIMLAALPENAMDVAAAKPTVAEGDAITLRGRIGGNRAPMTGESGIFLMMDPSLSPCPPDEGCPTPWDYCCETPDSKLANNATIQLVGADGNALAADFAALGLEPMDEVVVVGTVGPRPNTDVLIVRATGVHKVAGG